MTQSANIKRPVYLDYQATTPLDPRVLEVMMPFLTEKFGNPHSTSHSYGWEAAAAVERARGQVAELIGAAPEEIIFTSGATESNNLAIKGAARFYRARRDHLVTVVSEHKCVRESCAALEREGFRVTTLPVSARGLIDLARLEAVLDERTLLVSVMAVNNEIGVIQPLADIGRLCREKRVFFHTDAAQAAGKIPLDVRAMNIDMMSISGHKVYGPKGIGALFVGRQPRVRLEPLISGGGQEAGLRSGTLAPHQVVGLGEACALAGGEMADETARLEALFDHFHAGLTAGLPDVVLNGDAEARFKGNLNYSFPGVDGDMLLARLRDLAVSSGAACASASGEPSYVLEALGVAPGLAQASLRIGLGRFTTRAEVDYALETIIREVRELRADHA